MQTNDVRKAVEDFRREFMSDAFGKDDIALAPWYLYNRFHVAASTAIRNSSEGPENGTRSFDYGVDAFHLDHEASPKPRLVIVQAKFTEDKNALRTAVSVFKTKTLPQLAALLDRRESNNLHENKVIYNLRAALSNCDNRTLQDLELHFHIVILDSSDPDLLRSKHQYVFNEFTEACAELLPGHFADLFPIQPRHLEPQGVSTKTIAPPPVTLRLEHVALNTTDREAESMLLGFGHLADLVDLYRSRGAELFARNVRYFLRIKRNTESGPVGKMKDTLGRMCYTSKASAPPEHFAFFHNGVTVLTSSLQRDDGVITVLEPYVLNGCQTIKGAHEFYESNETKIDPARWDAIRLPLRIVRTENADFIRQITINNNRQNAMPLAALRANDPVQVDLEIKFKALGVFYERQRGAYRQIEARDPQILAEFYANTRGKPVEIETLGRAIACASGQFSHAASPSKIFEYDGVYEKVFAAKNRKCARLLLFVHNLYAVFPTTLRDLDFSGKGGSPSPSRMTPFAMCLFVRWLVKMKKREFALRWSAESVGTRNKQFRQELKKLCGNIGECSKLKKGLKERFCQLDGNKQTEMQAAFAVLEKDMRLPDKYNLFDSFADLDDSCF